MKELSLLPIHLTVGSAAKKHPHVIEARVVSAIMANNKNREHGGVVGTANKLRSELYGWHNPVRPHVDTTNHQSWIYGLILKKGGLSFIGCFPKGAEKPIMISAKEGQVFRMNDSVPHWAEGSGATVCLFVGSFREPCDSKAVTELMRGLKKLQNGRWSAPTLSDGFRCLDGDSVWATRNFEKKRIVPKRIAEQRGWTILTCSNCDNPATTIDHHWPYYWDTNSCDNHKEL